LVNQGKKCFKLDKQTMYAVLICLLVICGIHSKTPCNQKHESQYEFWMDLGNTQYETY